MSAGELGLNASGSTQPPCEVAAGAVDGRRRPQLSAVELIALIGGAGLAVVPSMPFLQSEAVLFVRFHNWAIFVGGLVVGAVITRAHARLDR